MRRGTADPATLPLLDVGRVAAKSGMAESTVAKHTQHPMLPWPTLILKELLKERYEGAAADAGAGAGAGGGAQPAPPKLTPLPQLAKESALWQLDMWLRKPQGAYRDWSREVRRRPARHAHEGAPIPVPASAARWHAQLEPFTPREPLHACVLRRCRRGPSPRARCSMARGGRASRRTSRTSAAPSALRRRWSWRGRRRCRWAR